MTEVAVVLGVVLLLAFVVWIVSGPWRGDVGSGQAVDEPERAALEAAKEAKYREIRDAELDFRTDKLSPEDHRELDRQLRAEAVEILRRLDELR